ncbi:MAG: winged helix-turn-helix domain-containing protein [Pyrinomonadaceae bacterium]
MNPPAVNFYEFGKFRLDAERCVLFDGDNSVVDATPKALEILCVLVESGGRVISKEEIIRRVWADSFVEEANLSHHIFRLRKALGENEADKFIETVSKRGYRFVAEVREERVQSPESKVQSHSESQTSDLKLQNSHSVFRNKTTLAILSLILLSALATVIFVWNKSGTTQENPIQNPKSKIQNPLTVARITNSGKVGAATISPDGKFVAYIQNYTLGEGMLYVRQVETNTEVKLLAPDDHIFGSISFSPDGAFIYYITYDKRDPDGTLYRIPVFGGQPTRLLGGVRYMFTLSPDGVRAAFFRDEPEQKQNNLIIAALDGSGERKLLTRRYDEMAFGVCPAWSADGKLIAFGAVENPTQNKDNSPQMNVFVVETENGAVKKLSNEALIDTGKMSWMPDGSGIALIGQQPRTGNQIYFLSYPAGDLRRITKELNTYGNYGMGVTKDGTTLVADLYESSSQLWAIEPNSATNRTEQLTTGVNDGSHGLAMLSNGSIVYSTRAGDDFDLWLMSEKSGKREGKPLTTDAFHETEICPTMDNRFLVFASDRAGNRHLFRMNADGSDVRQLTSGDSFDSAPDCSSDGNSIVYASLANGKTLLRRISIEGGDATQLIDFECVSPTFSPDGKMIACILPSDSTVKPATLVVISSDGGSPLKTFPVVQFSWNYHPPRWTRNGDALIFSKTENSVDNLWKQNLSGGMLQPITDFKSDTIFNYVFARDGKRLIIARGKFVGDVVAIKNFGDY